jgi:outer membrane protein assembly factor BamB
MSNHLTDMTQAKGTRLKAKGFFALCAFFAITVLTGCSAIDAVSEGVSGITDYFRGGEDNADPPSVLV